MAIGEHAPKAATAVNNAGDSPLSYCLTGESVDALVDLGADPCHKNKARRTPLHAAGEIHTVPINALIIFT